jgi:DNA polymerase-3 subunit gamma/tau
MKKMNDFLEIILSDNLQEAAKRLDNYWLESLEVELFFKDFAKYCKNLVSKNELAVEEGLQIIGAIYDGLNKFKFEEDKRLVGYVIIDKILNQTKQIEIREKIIEKEVEKLVPINSGGKEEIIDHVTLSLEEIQVKWAEILNAAKKEKATYRASLRSAKPHRVEKNILYVTFAKDDSYSKGLMEQKDYSEPFLQIVRNKIHPNLMIHYILTETQEKKIKEPVKDMGAELADFFEKGELIIE